MRLGGGPHGRIAIERQRTGARLQVVGATGLVLEVLRITGAAKQLGVYELR